MCTNVVEEQQDTEIEDTLPFSNMSLLYKERKHLYSCFKDFKKDFKKELEDFKKLYKIGDQYDTQTKDSF